MGKFNKHLKCKKNETFQECPICNSFMLPTEQWPQSGTHIFTALFSCGTEIDYPIGSNGAMYGVTCTGEVKRFEMPPLRDMDPKKLEELAEKFMAIDNKFKYKKFPNNGKLKNGNHPDCDVEEYW